jgi:hypothetical protein
MEAALAALYRAVKQQLTSSGSERWADRAYPDMAAANTPYPYVDFAWAAGGEVNELIRPDAVIVLMVSAWADTQAESFLCAGRISDLLNDADISSDKAMDGGADWLIINSSQEQAIHSVELVDGVWKYRDGARYRVRMEAK